MIALRNALAVGTLLLFAGCGTTNEAPCAHGSDCATGMVCVGGMCTGAMTCTSSRQCPDLVCNVTLGVCVECNSRMDCDPSLTCVDSVCVPPTEGMDSGVDAGMDAFVAPIDMGVQIDMGVPIDMGVQPADAQVDAVVPHDIGVDVLIDAFGSIDAYELPDAFIMSDAFADDTSGCDPGLRYCSGHCIDTTSDPMNCSNCGIACPGGYACISSGCMCITRCSGVCSDLDNDVNNCGACGHRCRLGDYCRGGSCFSPPCPEGQSSCGACVFLDFDPANCGACGVVCPPGQSCRAGSCTATCDLQFAYYGSGAACRENPDPSLTSCQPDQVCEYDAITAGPAYPACVQQCAAGLTQCGRACVNTELSTLHCGSCGHACAVGEHCANGACSSCPAGQRLCGASCVYDEWDPSNCGACGVTCSPGQSCRAGSCVASCDLQFAYYGSGAACRENPDPYLCSCQPDQVCQYEANAPGPSNPTCMQQCNPGLTQCGRACVNTQLSTLNCGSCGHACAVGEFCANGTCSSCPAGEHLCGTSCVYEDWDPSNCGGCGVVCGPGQSCRGGNCIGACDLQFAYYGSGAACRENPDPYLCSCQPDQVCQFEANGSGPGNPTCMQQCDPGLTQCGRACVNTQLSTLNCGSCAHACVYGEYCANGTCSSCPAGQRLCGTSCVSADWDPSNCGACGVVCAPGQSCRAGSCVASCDLLFAYYGSGAACRENPDPYLASCQPDQVCQYEASGPGGALPTCMQQCDAGLTQCGRACVNMQLSTLHCGSCAHACAVGESCANGTCSSCPAGQRLCGTSCVDESWDPGNCGACGVVCAPGQSCRAGTCVASCDLQFAYYGLGAACRENPDPSLASCQPNQVCEYDARGPGPVQPTCMQQCDPGLTQCGRACVNTQLSRLNCGSCGQACAVGEYCVDGACAHAAPD